MDILPGHAFDLIDQFLVRDWPPKHGEIPGKLARARLAAFEAHEQAGLELRLRARELVRCGALFSEIGEYTER